MLRMSMCIASALLWMACASGAANTAASGASRAASTAGKECQAVDTSFALDTPVHTECGVERPAQTHGRQPIPDFTPRPPIKECYGVVIAVVVDETGSPLPATARIVRSNDTQYAQAVFSTVPAWRFTPAQKAGVPVKQLVEIGQVATTRTVRSDRPMRAPPPSRPRC